MKIGLGLEGLAPSCQHFLGGGGGGATGVNRK